MTDVMVVEIGLRAAVLGAKLGAPVLLVSLIVGFAISLFQSATQMQDTSLSFVPKLAAVAVALLVSGTWMLRELVGFTTDLYGSIPDLLRGG